jgi:hypothetical protein
MKRIGLLGAIALLTSIVPSTPAIAIPNSWVQEEDFPGQGEVCDFGKGSFTCFFEGRGECEYWLNQWRRRELSPFPGTTLSARCVPAYSGAPEGAEWIFGGDFGA